MASYYRPYTSGSDSESESESDTGSYDSSLSDISESLPNFRALAGALAAGPSFDLSEQILFAKRPKGYPLLSEPTDFKGYEIKADTSGFQLKSTTQSLNSIIMLVSNDRDRSVYGQPTYVTLRLPRVYKNVTAFQIIQIKLLSSFFYFRPAKFNTDITILENGRAKITPLIREGTYDINSLMTEIQTQLNETPLFYDFPNGFQEFAIRFASTGDFGVNFNYPGETYYNSLTQTFTPNPTMTTIVSNYFQSQFAGLSSYTTDQLKVAYYYPVLKEALLNAAPIILDISDPTDLEPGETTYSRCIYTFQGIDDPVILEIINLNLVALDTYRLQNTFRYSLVNEYSVSLQTQSNRIRISSSSLNKSLVTLLQTKQAQYLAQTLTAAGLTAATYAALQTQNSLLLAVLNDMFYFLERYLAIYFGIPFNTYDLSYLASPEFVVPIRNAAGAVGISSNYDAAVLARGAKPITTNILAQFQQNPSYYWPGYSNVPNRTIPTNLETGDSETSSNYSYDIFTGKQDRSRRFIDLSSQILYTNALTRYSDIVVPLNAAEYTVLQFKSPVRQTLQIETLPRPTRYRYLAYNATTADVSNQQIFDNSYSFVNTQPAALDWILAKYSMETVPGFSTGPFGLTYSQSLALWGETSIRSYIGFTTHLFEIVTLTPSTEEPPPYRYPLSITLTSVSGVFVTPLNMFIYHDRAAFFADVSSNGSESPFNYLATANTKDLSSATLTLNVYAGQTYYILVRAPPTSATQTFRVVPWQASDAFEVVSTSLDAFDPLADPTSPQALSNFNYAQVTDPAWIQLPVNSALIPPTRIDPLYTPLTLSTIAIGYDANGVSTDLTNYFGYEAQIFGVIDSVPTRIDPISGYIFQKSSSYNTSTQTYFYNGSLNTILAPQGASVYTPSTVVSRQTSIVHTYYNTYLPNSVNQAPMLSDEIISPAYVVPFTSSITTRPIGGYIYGGSNASIQFGDGVVGISFVPQQGAWTLERAMIASAYTTVDPTIDTNRGIQYLGVFMAGQLPRYSADLHLTSSITVLRQSKVVTYGDSNTNFGFGVGGTTFYEFTRDPSFNSKSVYGYSQIPGTIDTDAKAIYTLVPFSASGKILPYQGLLGSLVPYPNINTVPVDVSAAYFDGTRPPGGQELIVPRAIGSTEYDITQSQYERSMPIGTTVMHYLTPYPFLIDPGAMQPWQTPATYVNPVFDVSGYLLTSGSIFHIYSYETSSRFFTEAYQIGLDQIVPESGAEFIGVAANEMQYAFAFYRLDTLILQLMEPATGRISSSFRYASPVAFDKVRLTSFTYNNAGGFTFSVRSPIMNSVFSLPTATSAVFTTLDISNGPILTRQSPQNTRGQFYAFPVSNGTITEYVYIDPTRTGSPNGLVARVGAAYAATTVIDLSGAYTNPIVAREPYREDLLFLKPGSLTLHQITEVSGNTAIITESVFNFSVEPKNLYQGPNGSKWAFSDILCANRNNATDAPKALTPAWQIFYPTQRLVFTQTANNFSFMQDRTGIEYPEYPHTAITVYDSLSKLHADIGSDIRGKWGMESSSNFLVGDYRFSGQEFHAEIFSVPLEPDKIYYTTLRNYTPTEKSQAILRCSLPNKYDFGYVKLADLSGEVAIAATSSNLFTPDYRESLIGFNSNFLVSSITFGANIIQGFNGSNISNITGFGDFYSRFTSLYATYNNQVKQVDSINAAVTSSINTFIQTDLKYILPSVAQNRQRYTDPLTFSILWKSSLTPNYGEKEDNWGLGWNLGYDKADTSPATVHISQSFFKILDDYINLRLNAEYDMNRVDSGAKENLSLTNEPTGSTKAFHAKLLLANFGSYAQTLISNPLAFSPPLGRMDKITFQWLDATETQIDNSDCEWNVVIQIVEKMEVVEIPKMPYVFPGAAGGAMQS